MDLENLTIKELKELIKDPNTSAGDLHQIYWMFKDWTIFADIAENPNVTYSTLQLIAGDEDPWVRALVAESSKCPSHLLHQFAADKAYLVRKKVWDNPDATEDDLLMIKAMRWMMDND